MFCQNRKTIKTSSEDPPCDSGEGTGSDAREKCNNVDALILAMSL